LAHLTESEYKSTSKIQPQVHRNGALIYSHPSMLGPLFYTKPKPGIVLQWEDSGRFTADKPQLLAAFAGVTAVLDPHDGEGLEPLMKEGSVDREMWPLAVAEFRPITKDALSLRAVPRVVGRDLDEGLSGVYMELDVSADRDKPSRENPYFPGTREYIALEGADLEDLEKPRGGSSRTAAGSAPAPTPPLRSLKNSPIAVGIQAQSSLYSITSNQQIQTNKETLSVLQNLLSSSGTRKADDKVGDQEL
jgi:hypothetical protein